MKIEEKMSSQNEHDWKLAIVDADIILEEMLGYMGYEGEGVAPKLKQADKNDFHTLQNAWDAHKLRNRIAHEGSDFHLSRTEAERTIDNLRKSFRRILLYLIIVAGTGLAPMPSGYEPDEVLLLHPAI